MRMYTAIGASRFCSWWSERVETMESFGENWNLAAFCVRRSGRKKKTPQTVDTADYISGIDETNSTGEFLRNFIFVRSIIHVRENDKNQFASAVPVISCWQIVVVVVNFSGWSTWLVWCKVSIYLAWIPDTNSLVSALLESLLVHSPGHVQDNSFDFWFKLKKDLHYNFLFSYNSVDRCWYMDIL